MKKIFLPLFIIILSYPTSQTSASNETLSTIFTAEESYLERLQSLKSTLKSPDHFSKELAELANEIVDKIGNTISSKDDHYELFNLIAKYAETEISKGTLTLNRLNYLTFQLSVAMNPNISSPHDIFEDVDLLIKNQIWMLPYDDALEGIKGYIDENLSEADPTEFESPQNLVMTIFRPCDRGQ